MTIAPNPVQEPTPTHSPDHHPGQAEATDYSRRPVEGFNWNRCVIVAKTELRQVLYAKDFWMPMAFMGIMFFLIIPSILLIMITKVGSVEAVSQFADTLEALPENAQEKIKGDDPSTRAAYALAVYLFAPLAIVVPLTISTAIGSSSIVGEREKGTGEFLAHSPASVREIFAGKLLASIVPGYATTLIGFGIYSLVVNILVGPGAGGWFFPTPEWLMLMFWVVPPFLLFTLSIVLRLSARVKSTAAAQQAAGLVSIPLIMVAYSQASGALFGSALFTIFIGALAWIAAIISLTRGMRALTRSRLLHV